MKYRELSNRINGRLTTKGNSFSVCSYRVAKPQTKGRWSSTENSSINARNVNFNSGNSNNNNKFNSNLVRPVSAFYDNIPADFIATVWEAYFDCMRGKKNSKQAIEYQPKAVSDIPKLASELWNGTYKPGTSTCFLVSRPKWREVFAANFRDRIVHHWICLRLNPLFEQRFVEQGNLSFNCRKGFGTEKCINHLEKSIEDVSSYYKKNAWVYHGDIVGFFMSIDKELLWYLLERFMKRWKFRIEKGIRENPGGNINMYWEILFKATETTVMHHPEKDCVLNTNPALWENLSPNKSLFTSPTGEPIGNLTTQLFANFFMSYFIQYVKYIFRGKNWGMAQFVDDFAIVCDDLKFLMESIKLIEKFLKDKLRLTLHRDKKYLQPVSHGIKFIGTVIKPGRKYLSNRTVGSIYNKIIYINKMFEKGFVTNSELQSIERSLNSYFGFCKRKKTFKIRFKAMSMLCKEFWKYFYFKGDKDSLRLKDDYR